MTAHRQRLAELDQLTAQLRDRTNALDRQLKRVMATLAPRRAS